ncbi:hypothetical protein AVEN_92211-1 [Araneus ventricosus]|uniref:Uncharacterized protein n=1 Tax=Araneus ventricosus TaxID=182803 RepID=A0A4Y2AKA8_ARAVE|nr:hypothetical protein AVEN_92211-1 [Araneus ventricosus]
MACLRFDDQSLEFGALKFWFELDHIAVERTRNVLLHSRRNISKSQLSVHSCLCERNEEKNRKIDKLNLVCDLGISTVDMYQTMDSIGHRKEIQNDLKPEPASHSAHFNSIPTLGPSMDDPA